MADTSDTLDRRLAERQAADDLALTRALDAAASTLRTPGGSLGTGADPLVDACAIALRGLGVRVLSAGAENGDILTRLEVLGERSGFGVREVRLEPGWQATDCAHMIVTRDEGTRPMATARHRGRTVVVDPVAKPDSARIPVRRAVVDSRAFQLFATGGDEPLTTSRLIGLARRRLGVLPVLLVLLCLAIGALTTAVPLAIGYAFSVLIPQNDTSSLPMMLIILLCITAASTLLTMTAYRLVITMRSRAREAVGLALAYRLTRMPADFFDARSSGAIGSQVLQAEAAFEAIGIPIAASLVSLTAALANCVFAFFILPILGVVATVSLTAAMTVIFTSMRRQRRLMIEHGARVTQQAGMALEIIDSIDKVRTAGAERRLLSRWILSTSMATSSWLAAQRGFVRLASLAAAWFTLSLAASLSVVAILRIPLTSAQLTTFTAVLVAVAAAMTTGLGATSLLTALLAQLDTAQPVLSHPTEFRGRPLPLAPRLNGELHVTGVRFRYEETAPWVLEDVSFTARPGEFLALVGPSGSGKSTLFRLLLGFEKPASGAVTFDSTPVTDVDARSLRRQLGVVLQRGRLVSGSILTNLALNRAITEEEAWVALEDAGLADDIRALPMGLHTSVGDGGSALSGGQRQRILIARALVGSPAYLLMDEATSALDNVTQARVSEALSRYRATRIVVAHRLSTIRHADRILVLDGGRIVEEGTYDELMEARELFYRLATRQVL